MDSIVSQPFNRFASGHERKADAVLNYVWINKTPLGALERYALCGVPLNYIDQAIANARKYSDCAVNVWIDSCLLDDVSRFFVDSYSYLSECENLRVRNLREIDAYANDQMFMPSVDTPLWSKVDYARLLVVEQSLKENASANVFYADFDVRDAHLKTPQVTDILSRHGIVVGATRHLMVENGYFGFNEKARALLCDKIIPGTKRMIDTGDSSSGYPIFESEINRWFCARNFPAYAEHISMPILNDMGYKIPFNPDHDGLGLYMA